MSFPQHVTISEVGLRDGLQIEKQFVSTAIKLELINELVSAGLRKIEVSSFVHPKVVPQMADAVEVFAGLTRRPDVQYAALVPNVKGMERAIACRADEYKIGISASETFNKLNFRMDIREGMKSLDDMVALQHGKHGVIIGAVSTAFGCPYEGAIAETRIHELFAQLVGFGVPLIFLADTTGVANPDSIRRTIEGLRGKWPKQRIGLHLHNTRGLGLANALAGLELGVDYFEGSIGGLGGCPFAPRAVGNISTEDFVHMVHEMGIETGVDLDALIGVAAHMQAVVGRQLPGMVLKAGKSRDLHDPQAAKVKVD
ncbi:MAG: hydroxymethylglutaryl-CoA lyase [Pseudorhodoplanes sp.]